MSVNENEEKNNGSEKRVEDLLQSARMEEKEEEEYLEEVGKTIPEQCWLFKELWREREERRIFLGTEKWVEIGEDGEGEG